MEQWKKSLAFWLMVVVSIVLPSVANAQVRTKKMVWVAPITVNNTQVGSSSISRIVKCTVTTSGCVQTSDEVRFTVITRGYQCANQPCEPGEALVTKASIGGPGVNNPWTRDLCEGATCTYNEDRDGELDLSGVLAEPLPGGLFMNLDGGTVQVLLNDGQYGVGNFTRYNP